MPHPRTHLRRDRWSNLENEIQRETRIVLLWRVFAGDIRYIDLEAVTEYLIDALQRSMGKPASSQVSKDPEQKTEDKSRIIIP